MLRNKQIETITRDIQPADLFFSQMNKSKFAWLDSSEQRNGWGGKSIFAENPIDEFLLKSSNELPSALEKMLSKIEKITSSGKLTAIGFISYEATLPWFGLSPKSNISSFPLAHFYLYDSTLSYNHETGQFDNQAAARSLIDSSKSVSDDNYDTTELNYNEKTSVKCIPLMSKEDYLESLNIIKWHIHEGDIYQANLTCGFEMKHPGNPQKTYNFLRKLNPASYSAYLDFGNYQLLSSSPERMFLKEGNLLFSSPIKGTIKRGENRYEETNNLKRLLKSEKNRSELLMIVDLVRNDLGKVSKTGTVHVENILRAEIYSSLIHLAADISGELKDSSSLCDICKAILPGGSITGTPKMRAMEIINELETVPRNAYTGVIGYIQGDKADFNIAIRTILHSNDSYRIHSGGGIVADSEPIDEYNEMLLKAKNLMLAVTGSIDPQSI